MDDNFNMSMRKFLKTVGVTGQQQIEEAVRKARDAGTLPKGALTARAVITIDGVDIEHEVTGEILVGGD